MRKVGAITFVRSEMPYVIPHIRMMENVDRNVVLYIDTEFDQVHYDSEIGDVRKKIRQAFPKIEILETKNSHLDGKFYNELLDIMSDCDVVLFPHADLLFNKADWDKLVEFVRTTNHKVYKLNMPVTHTDYYYDFDHGLKDCLDIDPIGATPDVRFQGYWDTPEDTVVIDWVTGHHFNGWKGLAGTKDWVDGKITSDGSTLSTTLLANYGDNGEWYTCPQEIRDLFKAPH